MQEMAVNVRVLDFVTACKTELCCEFVEKFSFRPGILSLLVKLLSCKTELVAVLLVKLL